MVELDASLLPTCFHHATGTEVALREHRLRVPKIGANL